MKSYLNGFAKLSTALVFDASVRLGLPIRAAPQTIRPLIYGVQVAGPALPARHTGSVDVFLEAIDNARKGDVLVVDDKGRTDRACIGDLVTLEAKVSELSGIAVWGCHRDTRQLQQIGFPVFSLGPAPSAPTKVTARPKDALRSAKVGNFQVTRTDTVFADEDGVLFFQTKDVGELLEKAQSIAKAETRQTSLLLKGRTLRSQLQFNKYLTKAAKDRSYTFRKHLRSIGGAVEE